MTTTPTPELVKRLRKEIPYNADGFSELRNLADEAAAAIAKLTAERDALQRWKDIRAAEITDDQKRMAALEAERDASGDELGRVVLACPMSPRYRMHPTSAGVRNLRKDFEAGEASNKLLSERVAVLEKECDRWRDRYLFMSECEKTAVRKHTQLSGMLDAIVDNDPNDTSISDSGGSILDFVQHEYRQYREKRHG
ncbi:MULTISPECIES: hypothetical protein [unclassified Phyllobacterium]|uniref:hypothetical protein n=1 Tax=unclassified Phyllobacterium TaxID=2638441 RepID=UPI003012C56F